MDNVIQLGEAPRVPERQQERQAGTSVVLGNSQRCHTQHLRRWAHRLLYLQLANAGRSCAGSLLLKGQCHENSKECIPPPVGLNNLELKSIPTPLSMSQFCVHESETMCISHKRDCRTKFCGAFYGLGGQVWSRKGTSTGLKNCLLSFPFFAAILKF